MSQGFVNQTGITLPLAVSQGGTGRATATAYGVLCAGTTATGAQQSIASVGTSGQVLTSNGPGALPTMQDATSGGGSVQVWCYFVGTGTPSITDSYQMTSITDNGTGYYSLNFSVTLDNATYVLSGTCGMRASNAAAGVMTEATSIARSTTLVAICTTNPSSFEDFPKCSAIIYL